MVQGSVTELTESRSKLRQTTRDTVRLLQALMDLSGLKIINSRTTDLANINAVVDGSPICPI